MVWGPTSHGEVRTFLSIKLVKKPVRVTVTVMN